MKIVTRYVVLDRAIARTVTNRAPFASFRAVRQNPSLDTEFGITMPYEHWLRLGRPEHIKVTIESEEES